MFAIKNTKMTGGTPKEQIPLMIPFQIYSLSAASNIT